jgi:hypothetical protein
MTFEGKHLDKPEETRSFSHGELGIVNLPGLTIGKVALQPGWRWSHDVKPLVGTDSCQETHNGYVLSGRLHVRMDDGTEGELSEGEAFVLSPGHDAWVLGEEPYIALDWSAADTYAKAE